MLSTKIIGDRITDARKKTTLSQAQLAERLFISPQAVGKWERGESLPDIVTLNHLAEILGVDLNYFSENFTSITSEPAPSELSEKQAAEMRPELPASKTGKKIAWDMSNGNWVDVDFSGLKNLQEKFGSCNMQRCLFIGSELSGLLLRSNNVDRCDFSNSDISNSRIQNSNLAGNVYTNCSLTATEFSGSFIMGCDFSGADFTGATFKSGGLQSNIMTNAIIKNTSFNAMQLADMVFEGTVEDCYFDNCAFSKITFQNATITNTFFKGRSLKRIKFIDSKVDKLTYAFLKSGKADLTGVTVLIDE
jgi:uncharacterized protein YjbI with pentapeptide repeats